MDKTLRMGRLREAPPEPEMALRDWFAGRVMPICFDTHHGNEWGKHGKEHAPKSARMAYKWADAMLAARKGPGHD